MIKFFRHIRKSLITQNRISKYLKYAVGEIILVVIGILIALQVNNLNSKNKLNDSANQHTLILIEDLKEDNSALKNLQTTLNTQLESSNNLLNYFKLKTQKEQMLFAYIVDLIIEYNFKPNAGGYEILVNTGEVSVLSDKLQTLISEYMNQLKYIEEREFISNNFIQTKFEDHLFDNHPYIFLKGNPHKIVADLHTDDLRKPIQIEDVNLKSDAKLEALIFGRRFQIDLQLKAYEKGIELNNLLIKELQKRLTSYND